MPQPAADAGALLDLGNIALLSAVSARRLERLSQGDELDQHTCRVLERMGEILREASDEVITAASQSFRSETCYPTEVLQMIVRGVAGDEVETSAPGPKLQDVSESINATLVGDRENLPALVRTLRKLSDSAASYGAQLSRGDTERPDE